MSVSGDSSHFLLQSLPALLNLLLCSVQLIFFILLHIHISKASSLFISSFLVAHVCDSYHMTLHSFSFFTRFVWFLSSFPLRSSFLFENVSSLITILLLISMRHLASIELVRGHPFMTSTRRREGVRLRWTHVNGGGRGGQAHVDVHTEN